MKKLTLFSIMALLLSFQAHATTINVPADQPTIQLGIDASTDGDTVLVQPGTYVENIDFNGHNIMLGSLFLTTGDTAYIASTVIDGDGLDAVVTFNSGEDSSAVITGFTIQNGFTWDDGGGISCNSSSPIIRNNIIKDNVSDSGGGIKCSNSNALIADNIIHNNTFCSPSGNPGGGICCIDGSDCVIINNIIHSNENQDGAAIACYNSTALVSNNLIYNNHAFDLGGGIRSQGNVTIINSTFYGNLAREGGALYLDTGSDLIITNSIFWNDEGSIGADEIHLAGTASINYSNIEGGWAGEGNIDADPLFVDPDIDDYHLTEGSPCIDAGDPNSPADPDGTISDQGALYFDQGGSAPQIEISIDTLFFDSTMIIESDTLSFLIFNTGNADLIIHDISCSLPDVISILWNPEDSLLIPGNELEIEVVFTPQETVLYRDVIIIANNDEEALIVLEGQGLPLNAVGVPSNAVPTEFALFPAYPNPFNSRTTISVGLPETAELKISVFNILGEEMTVLVSNRLSVGYHQFTLNAKGFSSGTYFVYAIVPGKMNEMRKIVLLK